MSIVNILSVTVDWKSKRKKVKKKLEKYTQGFLTLRRSHFTIISDRLNVEAQSHLACSWGESWEMGSVLKMTRWHLSRSIYHDVKDEINLSCPSSQYTNMYTQCICKNKCTSPWYLSSTLGEHEGIKDHEFLSPPSLLTVIWLN